jgi:dolichol-phosphate mannosyltransferase
MSFDVSVIVPTYREAENLPVLVPKVASALEGAGLHGEIIVVDDNSPDSTPAVCADLQTRYPLRLLVRTTERGLSSAVVHGMREATGDVLVVMDADLSHPPEKVPELVRAVRRDGADFVIGSRYVDGGRTAEDWGLLRWLNSKGATLLARPLCSAADPMAGFFAMPRAAFEACEGLDPIGYKIGLELLVKSGASKVQEVSIDFRNRLHGESKLTLKEQVNYLRHLKRLYEFKLGRAARPLQFALVGSTGLVVDLICFMLLALVTALPVARAVAIWFAMTWNFYLNRRLTFSYARSRPALPQYCLFCLSCLTGAVVNWGTSMTLCRSLDLFWHWPALAAVCGVMAGMGFNYLFSVAVVFRRAATKGPLPWGEDWAPGTTKYSTQSHSKEAVGSGGIRPRGSFSRS